MFKKTALIAGIGLALSATAQADYRWELGAGYAYGDADLKLRNTGNDQNKSPDADIYNVNGTYYLETVDTSKGPLGEAAFLDHASNVTLSATDGELDQTNFDDDDGQRYNIQTRYVAEGPGWKLSGVIVDLGYEHAEPADRDIDTWNTGLGYYVTQNTTFVLNYKASNIKNAPGSDIKSYGAQLEHFFPFSSGGLKARAGGGKTVVSGLDDPTNWNIGATWYLNNNWGLGADYRNDDLSGYETDQYSVNAQWFVTESFAVDLAYKNVEPDDIKFSTGGKLESSYDEYSISALYRF